MDEAPQAKFVQVEFLSDTMRQRAAPLPVVAGSAWVALIAMIVLGHTHGVLGWLITCVATGAILIQTWCGQVVGAYTARGLGAVGWVVTMFYLLLGTPRIPAVLLQPWYIGFLAAIGSAVFWMGPTVLLLWPHTSRAWFGLEARGAWQDDQAE